VNGDQILASNEQFTLSGHTHGVAGVAFAPDSGRLATGSTDETARLWSYFGYVHWTFMRDVAFSPDGTTLATAGASGIAQLWDTATGMLLPGMAPPPQNAQISRIIFAPPPASGSTTADDLWLAMSGANRTARLWNARTGATVVPLQHAGEVDDAAFSPDGSVVATASRDLTAMLWDRATGAMIAPLGSPCGEVKAADCHDSWVSSVAFSPTQPVVITGSWDRGVRLWNSQTGAFIHRLALPSVSNPVRRIAMHPKGHRLAIATDDGRLTIANLDTRTPVTFWTAHPSTINAIAYSPDGTRIVSVGDDRTARLWDSENGKLLLTLTMSASVNGAAFDATGTLLATVGNDRQVHLFLLEPDRLIKLARDRRTRDLTDDECRRYLPADELCRAAE
jgi:WD40 repeat protein